MILTLKRPDKYHAPIVGITNNPSEAFFGYKKPLKIIWTSTHTCKSSIVECESCGQHFGENEAKILGEIIECLKDQHQ